MRMISDLMQSSIWQLFLLQTPIGFEPSGVKNSNRSPQLFTRLLSYGSLKKIEILRFGILKKY
jgi:hypothetical protein